MNYYSEYKKVKRIMPYMIEQFIKIYSSEITNITNSEEFLIGRSIEIGMEITESIVSMIECGRQ